MPAKVMHSSICGLRPAENTTLSQEIDETAVFFWLYRFSFAGDRGHSRRAKVFRSAGCDLADDCCIGNFLGLRPHYDGQIGLRIQGFLEQKIAVTA